jgi:DnaJ domain
MRPEQPREKVAGRRLAAYGLTVDCEASKTPAAASFAGVARDFVVVAWEKGCSRATGALSVQPLRGMRQTITVRDGGIISCHSDALGRRADAELSRLAAIPNAVVSFDAGPVEGRGRPWPLDRWARRAIDRMLSVEKAEQLTRELGSATLTLNSSLPIAIGADECERVLLEHLARGAKLGELFSAARVPRYRVLSLVHFVLAVGALEAPPPSSRRRLLAGPPAPTPLRPPKAAALELLGVPPGASADVIKAAFRRLAKALHPDLHPGIGEVRRRDLERQLALVNAAYGELTAS